MKYDTLTQLGRWFGYRPSYDNLCRVGMPEAAQGLYRANIVAYAISKIAHDVAKLNLSVGFDRMWKLQPLSPNLTAALEVAAKAANEVLTDPPAMTRNVTEWAKNQAAGTE